MSDCTKHILCRMPEGRLKDDVKQLFNEIVLLRKQVKVWRTAAKERRSE